MSVAVASNPVVCIEDLSVSAYRIPTESPESDGTLAWQSTTLVLVEATAGGKRGLGYTYAHEAAAVLIKDMLAEIVVGSDAFAIGRTWARLVAAIRNLGRSGITAMAIAAVDNALWDLKARLCEMSLAELWAACDRAFPYTAAVDSPRTRSISCSRS